MAYFLSDINFHAGNKALDAPAKEELKKCFYHLSMVDFKLPDGSGIELLKEIKKTNQDMMVIVFTGFVSLESSVAALNEGAFVYIQKPLNMDEVRLTIKKALKMQQLTLDNKSLLNRLRDLSLKDPLTGLYNYRYCEKDWIQSSRGRKEKSISLTRKTIR